MSTLTSANSDYLLEILQDSGLVDEAALEVAAGDVQGNETVVEALIRNGFVSEDDVARTAAVNASMEYIDLDAVPLQAEVLSLLNDADALRFHAVPIGFDESELVLAIGDPLNFDTIDSLPHVVDFPVRLVCASPKQIEALLAEHYGAAEQEAAQAGIRIIGQDLEEGGATEGDAPIIKMVTQMLVEAHTNRASDIHIEPLEKNLRIRYRIDGKLHEIANHPKKLHSAVLSRLKIMTGTMSIDEKRLPQDGRIQARVGDKELDLRVSSIPTNHGESIVMRILDKSSLLLGLGDLGYFSDDQAIFAELIGLPDGIILVTGPTGSGKTTTLYACLNEINKPDRKIITVEDPVEYQLSGINQVQVKEKIGMSFAAALRSILRQAPNIIMIGEIRDLETAGIAINAALTGHLVFSTLHTNDAPSAVARLTDIGVKPFLTSSAVRAIIAQRLVRKLCPDCKEPGEISKQEMRALNLDSSRMENANVQRPVGCNKCRMSGYRGRMGITEIFRIDDEARHMINENLSTAQLRRRARELGMRTLREDGIRKALAGMTTAGEVIHITMGDAS
ncbi:ATPase, T2SS/T4P/T4SS family [soil metagenome]